MLLYLMHAVIEVALLVGLIAFNRLRYERINLTRKDRIVFCSSVMENR